MVSAVSSNAGMMPIMLGMGSDPKKIADKIFAKLDSETIGMFNAPDTAGARHASAETAVASDTAKAASAQRKEVSAADWKEHAQVANATYEHQMQQIRVAQDGQEASSSAKPIATANPQTSTTSAERSSTEFHALLASFVTPADANGDGKISSTESLTHLAKLSSPLRTASAQSAPSNRISEQSLQSYRAMQQAPVAWMASAASAVGLAA